MGKKKTLMPDWVLEKANDFRGVLHEYAATLTGEERDYWVYYFDGEFNLGDSMTVDYLTEQFMDMIFGKTSESFVRMATLSWRKENYIIPVKTSEDYKLYLAQNDTPRILSISDSIAQREARDEQVRRGKHMTYIPFLDDFNLLREEAQTIVDEYNEAVNTRIAIKLTAMTILGTTAMVLLGIVLVTVLLAGTVVGPLLPGTLAAVCVIGFFIVCAKR